MNIKFLGDISLNGRYIEMYLEGRNPFETLEKKLKEANYVVGNLESFAKGEYGENLLKTPRLTTTVKTLNYLNNIQIDVACLANNHVYDHREDGFFKTTSFLNDNDITYLGAAKTKEGASQPVILEKNGVKIGLLNYVTADTNPNLPDNAGITPNYFKIGKAIEEIKKIKPEVHHVVLSLHWGGRTEGGSFPDFDQPKIAKQLIDHGADLIVGHHSHTLQPYEIYNGKYIFYSLGNFCFSDFWFNGKYYPLAKKRRLTSILQIYFTPDDYKTSLHLYHNHIEYFEKLNNNLIKRLNGLFKIMMSIKPLWRIYYIHLKYFSPMLTFLGREDISMRKKSGRIYKSLKNRFF